MSIFPRGTSFLFVGKMNSMTREQARAKVKSLGGTCPSGLSTHLDYLVLGAENSPLYGQGEKKPKQVKAEALIEAGAPIAIITEEEFLNMISAAPGATATP